MGILSFSRCHANRIQILTNFLSPRFELNNGNKELTISDLIIEDEGWYKCLVKTDEGKAEAAFRIYVLGL